MTEAEWLACEDTEPMLAKARGLSTDLNFRKLRLFAVACCSRQTARYEPQALGERAIDAAARFCDSEVSFTELDDARADIEARLELYPGEPVYSSAYWACSRDIASDVKQSAGYAATAVAELVERDPSTDFDTEFVTGRARALRDQCELLRDIFGNPFRPVAFSSSWRSDTAVSLARGMYESRDFSAMPILADALQDADCDNDGQLGFKTKDWE